jgi:hypothetical protein
VANATHGRRLYDTLKEYCGITAEDLIQVSEFPSMLPSSFQVEFNEIATQVEIDRFENEVILGGLTPLPGAIDLVSKACSFSSDHC